MTITNIRGLEIIDSRGNPTVSCYIELSDGTIHHSAVPSGASIGIHEAKEIRDDNSRRYFGKGVLKAIENIEKPIFKALKGKSVNSPQDIDETLLELDPSENKSILGANATLAVSQAALKASAHATHVPLWQSIHTHYFPHRKLAFPRLFINVVNGGKHANWSFDIQEFVITPKKTLPSQSVRIGVEIFQSIKKELLHRKLSIAVGDEGGVSPLLHSNEEVFELIIESAVQAKYTPGTDFDLGIDAAASQLLQEDGYTLKKEHKKLSSSDLQHRYQDYIKEYGITFFEDPFGEDDWDAFINFTRDTAGKATIIGDDLFATNGKRLEKGIKTNAANGAIIKPNQIGTILETVHAIRLSQNAGWTTILSHRSGDTEDSFIADLAYGAGADFLKTGSMSRSERLAKYNRLLEIEKFETEH